MTLSIMNRTRTEYESYWKSKSRLEKIPNGFRAWALDNFWIYGPEYAFPKESCPWWIGETGYWESWQTKLTYKYLSEGNVAVDIGACVGYYTGLMSRCVGNTGQVYCIEANTKLQPYLQQMIDVNNFKNTKLYANAITDTDNDKIQLKIGKGNSIGTASVVLTFKEIEDIIITETKKLDSIIEGHVDVLKIDVESAEDLVWNGMQNILDRSPKIKIFLETSQHHRDLCKDIFSRYKVYSMSGDAVLQRLTEIVKFGTYVVTNVSVNTLR